MITLSNLTYYPIKACRGFDVQSSNVERMGLEHDRRMMVVTPEGKFLTQREYPRLALITPALKNEAMTLSAPNFDSIQIGIQKNGTPTPVDIWRSSGVDAIDQGDEVAAWLSDWLGITVRLVHIAEGYKRKVNSTYAVNSDDHTGFADGFPILIISEVIASGLKLEAGFCSSDESIPPEHCRQGLRALRRRHMEARQNRRRGNGACQTLRSLRSDHHRPGHAREEERTAQNSGRVSQTQAGRDLWNERYSAE